MRREMKLTGGAGLVSGGSGRAQCGLRGLSGVGGSAGRTGPRGTGQAGERPGQVARAL